MNAIVSVYGKDRVGIVYNICKVLAENNINILDLSQTIMQSMFTMTMLVDIGQACAPLTAVRAQLDALGKTLGIAIHIQSEEIFTAMHTI